jgi:streptogramin lyase
MLLDKSGNFWAATFPTSDDIFELDSAGRVIHKITVPPGYSPLGLALHPDGNYIYVVFHNNSVGRVDLDALAAFSPVVVPSPHDVDL